jgi:hypothetical protein
LTGKLLSPAQATDGKDFIVVVDPPRCFVDRATPNVVEPISGRPLRTGFDRVILVSGRDREERGHCALGGRVEEEVADASVAANVVPEGQKVVVARVFVRFVQVVLKACCRWENKTELFNPGAGATFDWLFFDNSKLIDFDC